MEKKTHGFEESDGNAGAPYGRLAEVDCPARSSSRLPTRRVWFKCENAALDWRAERSAFAAADEAAASTCPNIESAPFASTLYICRAGPPAALALATIPSIAVLGGCSITPVMQSRPSGSCSTVASAVTYQTCWSLTIQHPSARFCAINEGFDGSSGEGGDSADAVAAAAPAPAAADAAPPKERKLRGGG